MSESEIRQTTVDSPIGPLVLEAEGERLVGIKLPEDRGRTRSAPSSAAARWRPAGRRSGALHDAARQLGEYFAGKRRRFELPLETSGTDFQQQVWWALADIPYGATVSYGELAAMVGRPAAYRAVGQANGANPLPIVLPCHRVLASGGRIGGYGGGLSTKRRLLAIEGVTGV